MLRACFDCTCWDVLYDECCDLDTNVDVCTSYINFCTDMLIPSKSVTIFSNNKPWVTKEVKEVINRKKRSLSNNRVELKAIQNELNCKIREAKTNYKDKIEALFRSTNCKDAWKGLKFLSGNVKKCCIPEPDDMNTYVDELNNFYARFDVGDYNEECDHILHSLQVNCDERIVLTEQEVLQGLNRAKPGKACGPDKVTTNVIKLCKSELVTPMLRLFQCSLDLCKIPEIWKTSEVVPVPKVNIPTAMNNLRPVALTSDIMKCFESIVKKHLWSYVQNISDKFQFAYRSGRSVDDAVVTLLDILCAHLDHAKCYSRLLFIDFSSAFNTIKPHIMLSKLCDMNVQTNIIKWIHSYLTSRPQYVRLNGVKSNVIVTNTGAPQGCVLSPMLFTLYTNDCTSTNDQCQILKYADDTVILGNITNDNIAMYEESVKQFVSWCDLNFLNLNVKKTMEMIIDFRRDQNVHTPLTIKNECVNVVSKYKYLGVFIDDKLSFSDNIQHLYVKCIQRVRFLRELVSVRIDQTILTLFYRSIIESVMSYCIVSWYGSSTKKDQKKLCKILRIAKRYNIKVDNLHDLHKSACQRLANKIIKDSEHPLHYKYEYMRSGKRLRLMKHRTNRYGNSFVPCSIKLLNFLSK